MLFCWSDKYHLEQLKIVKDFKDLFCLNLSEIHIHDQLVSQLWVGSELDYYVNNSIQLKKTPYVTVNSRHFYKKNQQFSAFSFFCSASTGWLIHQVTLSIFKQTFPPQIKLSEKFPKINPEIQFADILDSHCIELIVNITIHTQYFFLVFMNSENYRCF